jgi:hypothetical protein
MYAVPATTARPLPVVAALREIAHQLTPNWFTVTMGTGILALALNQVPFAAPELHRLAEMLWLLNIGIFAVSLCLYTTRRVLKRDASLATQSCRCSSAQFRRDDWPLSSTAFSSSALLVGCGRGRDRPGPVMAGCC